MKKVYRPSEVQSFCVVKAAAQTAMPATTPHAISRQISRAARIQDISGKAANAKAHIVIAPERNHPTAHRAGCLRDEKSPSMTTADMRVKSTTAQTCTANSGSLDRSVEA